MNKSYLSRLGTFTHLEIKALALPGLLTEFCTIAERGQS
jgi:hypothetical protein